MKIDNQVLNGIWKDRYSKNGENIDENLHRVANYIGSTIQEKSDFFNVMDKGLFFPAGRTMSNSGIGTNLTLNNCFVANFVEDNIEDIFDKVKLGALTHKRGGGIGYDFSKLRPRGSLTSNDAIASGVCSFMDVFNTQTATILQGGRRGANMGILSIYHPDIFDYLDAKSFDEGRLTHFNLSIMIDDNFMNAKNNNEKVILHYPIYDNKGLMINDPSQWIYTKEVDANELWDIIMTKAYNTGEYGVFFYDNLNRDNNTYYMETIVCTNPCFTEDMKLLTDKGYIEIGTLDGQEVNIVNQKGNITKGKVWCSGEKETIKVNYFNNRKPIKCTPNHIFMLDDGSECEAKDLVGKRIMPFGIHSDCPLVKSIESNGINKVYDFSEPELHWGVIEGIIVHNCGEYLSGLLYGKNPSTNEEIKTEEYMGACNLGSLFLHNYVMNPFTKQVRIDYSELKNAINIGVRLLDNIIDINKFPHQAYENYQKNMRTIGLGDTGIADVLTMFNIKYGSKKAIEFVDKLENFITKEAYKSSINLAREKGSFPFLDREKFVQSGFIQKHVKKDVEWQQIVKDILIYGIRNARIRTEAPVGTLSLTFGNNCSSGLEPIFSLDYDRKVKIGGQDESDIQIVKMEDYAYGLWKRTDKNNIVKEDIFVTAMNLPVQSHLDMLKAIAFHVDMSCSKTINIPTDYPYIETKKVYDYCWENGIKGSTIFRPNPIRQGIMVTNDQSKVEVITNKLERGQWKPKASDTFYYERKLTIGCGKLMLFIGWSDSEKEVQDFFVIRSGRGGCEKNIQTSVIAMSGMLRLGGKLENIERAFEGVGVCNSFVGQRAKGVKLSKGSSCGTVILNEIKSFHSEMNTKEIKEIIIPKKQVTPQDIDVKTEELDYLKENGEIAFAKHYNKCPVCGEHLENTGGCMICQKGCGWSKCE
jgi:ribonucleotide reductase alpha subunit